MFGRYREVYFIIRKLGRPIHFRILAGFIWVPSIFRRCFLICPTVLDPELLSKKSLVIIGGSEPCSGALPEGLELGDNPPNPFKKQIEQQKTPPRAPNLLNRQASLCNFYIDI